MLRALVRGLLALVPCLILDVSQAHASTCPPSPLTGAIPIGGGAKTVFAIVRYANLVPPSEAQCSIVTYSPGGTYMACWVTVPTASGVDSYLCAGNDPGMVATARMVASAQAPTYFSMDIDKDGNCVKLYVNDLECRP